MHIDYLYKSSFFQSTNIFLLYLLGILTITWGTYMALVIFIFKYLTEDNRQVTFLEYFL